MKKISVFLTLVLALSLLAGCAGTPVVYYTECNCPNNAPVVESTPNSTEAELPEGAVKDRMADLLFDLICQAPMQKNSLFLRDYRKQSDY